MKINVSQKRKVVNINDKIKYIHIAQQRKHTNYKSQSRFHENTYMQQLTIVTKMLTSDNLVKPIHTKTSSTKLYYFHFFLINETFQQRQSNRLAKNVTELNKSQEHPQR